MFDFPRNLILAILIIMQTVIFVHIVGKLEHLSYSYGHLFENVPNVSIFSHILVFLVIF